MEFMLTGKHFNAERAYEVGMVNKVVPVGEQVAGAMEYAEIMRDSAPMVVRTVKRFVRDTVVNRGRPSAAPWRSANCSALAAGRTSKKAAQRSRKTHTGLQ